MLFGHDYNVVRTIDRGSGWRTMSYSYVDGPRSIHLFGRNGLQCRTALYWWQKNYVTNNLIKSIINNSCYQPHTYSGPDDELEEAYAMPDLPQLMNLESFRNAILERFNDRLGIDHVCDILYIQHYL